MKKRSKPLVAILVATLMASPNAFAYGDFNARMDCIGKVTGWGSGYTNARDLQLEKKEHNSYVVTGKVDDRNHHDQNFTCRIEHKEVVSWKVDSKHKDSDKSDKKLLIGAGIIGLAAIAAIAANSNKDSDHDESRSKYNAGNGSPFDDMGYLRKECRRIVRQHLNEDHGRVEDLEFNTADLDGRTLTGRGKVFFENDHSRKLEYRCQFDRAGNIHDGHYEYRHEDNR